MGGLGGGQRVVRALEAEGVELAFGIPGTHNIELYDALAASESVRTVLVTDEQSASFMADGAWRASGRLACVNLVPGAGLTHALSGIAEAWMDQIPMLVLGCGIRLDTGMAYQLHDVDQAALVRPVVKETFRPRKGPEIGDAIARACALARRPPGGPVFVEIPANLYLFRTRGEGGGGEGTGETGGGDGRRDGRSGGGTEVDSNHVARVADLLRAARRPLLYLGAGALPARDALLQLVEQLQIPFSTTFTGKGVLPEPHPLFLWPGFGDAAPPFVRALASECDMTLAVGCRFAEVGTGSYGIRPPRPLVHVDVDPDVPGRNVPTDLAITAEAGAFARALLQALDGETRPPDAELQGAIRRGREAFRAAWRSHRGEGVNPLVLMEALQERLGPDAVWAVDSGNGTFLAVEGLSLDHPRSFLAPVDYSCMGYSVPAAIGAKAAAPHRPSVALTGDGAFLMTGLELLTSVRENLGVMVFVLRDGELAQIAQFQSTALNRPVASEVPAYDLVGLGRSLGVEAMELSTNVNVATVVDRAAGTATQGKPVLVDVAIDYSRRTSFTRGVVKTNLLRLPLPDRLRFVGRALLRRLPGGKT
jgi:acetolactate synthase I/II/III large subunit